MITSCSPGWIKYIEHVYPDRLPHLSTCKSPHTMLGLSSSRITRGDQGPAEGYFRRLRHALHREKMRD
jgi:iron only hydrogenase large subunit-like protein